MKSLAGLLIGLVFSTSVIASTGTLRGEIGVLSVSPVIQPSGTSTITIPLTLDDLVLNAQVKIFTMQKFVTGDSLKSSIKSKIFPSIPTNVSATFSFGSQEQEFIPFWIYVISSDGDVLARDLVHFSSQQTGGGLVSEESLRVAKGYELLPPSPPGTNPPETTPQPASLNLEPGIEYPQDDVYLWDCTNHISVLGTVQYEDINGDYRPVKFAQVKIYDDDPVGDDLLGSGTTDQNGYFSIVVANCDGWSNIGADIYIKVYFRTDEFTVMYHNGNDIRLDTMDDVVEDTRYTNVNYGTINVADWDNATNDLRYAAGIYDGMLKSWQLAVDSGIDPGEIYGCLTRSMEESQTTNSSIFIPAANAMNMLVTAHEYAHAMYWNNNGAFPIGNHNLWTTLSEDLAFSEGFSWFWANAVLTSLATNDPEIHVLSSNYSHFNIESFQTTTFDGRVFPTHMPSNGRFSEGWVAGALWDLYDIGPDDLDQNLFPVSLSDILDARCNEGVENFGEMENYFGIVSGSPSITLDDLMRACENNQIDINDAPSLNFGPVGLEMEQGDTYNPYVDFSGVVSELQTPYNMIEYTITTNPSNNPMGATLSGGVLSINPAITWYGTGQINVTASDGIDNCATDAIIVLSCAPFPAPSAPILSMSAPFGSHPTLTWTDGSQPGIDHYVVKYQYVNSSGTYTGYDYDATQPWVDEGLLVQKFGSTTANYWVKAVNVNNVSSPYSNKKSTAGLGPMWKKTAEDVEIPTSLHIYDAFPNPFNPSVNVQYDLPCESQVNIIIFDISGKMVDSESFTKSAGSHYFEWNNFKSMGTTESGIYILTLDIKGTDNESSNNHMRKTQKITLLR